MFATVLVDIVDIDVIVHCIHSLCERGIEWKIVTYQRATTQLETVHTLYPQLIW